MPIDMSITQDPQLKALCEAELAELSTRTHSMRVAIIATMDGFPLASLNLEPQESRRVTAMSAAFSGLSMRIIQELALNSLEGAVLETSEGLVLCRQVSNEVMPLVLLVVTGTDENYGFALLAVKRAAANLGEALTGFMAARGETA